MPSTYTLISSNVLSSSAASVTFSAIPSTYTDLVVRASSRSTDTGSSYFTIRFNEDTATNYSYTRIRANSNFTVDSGRATNATYISETYMPSSTTTANTFSNDEIYIPSYTSTQNKQISTSSNEENNLSTPWYVAATAGLWRNTAAITSITLGNLGVNFVSGSSFYLYGIKNS
jgi:hypothetical protein